MTAEPASTRANRINSDSLDWSYIGISVTVGHSTSARRGRRRSAAPSPPPPSRIVSDLLHCFHCSLRSLGLGPATGLLKTKARIARKHGSWIAVANAADKVRLDPRAGKKDLIHASVVEARHGAAVQSQRPRSDDEVGPLQRPVPHCRHLGYVRCREVFLDGLGIVRHE